MPPRHKTPRKATDKRKNKRRIRKHKKCAQCGKLIINIWRHMKDIHGESEKEEQNVVSPMGYIIRICPIEECCTIVERMRDHLNRTHGIPNVSKQMKTLLLKAEPLKEKVQEKKAENKIEKKVENFDKEQEECTDGDSDQDRGEVLAEIHERRFDQIPIIMTFIAHLIDPPNLKGRKESFQHGYQVHQIWTNVSKCLVIQNLMEIKAIYRWMEQALEEKKPGTVKSYLSSLVIFVEFLIANRRAPTTTIALRFVDDVRQLAKNMKRKVLMRRTVVETEEIGESLCNII